MEIEVACGALYQLYDLIIQTLGLGREPDNNVGWYLVQLGMHEASELVSTPLFLSTPG